MKLIFVTYLFISVFSELLFAQQPKIEGVSLVSVKTKLDTSNVTPTINLGANWTSLVTFCDFKIGSECELIYNQDQQLYGERIQGMREMIQLFQSSGMKVMVKPQVREKNGKYVGQIDFQNKADWITFEQSYREYIFAFAKLAQSESVDLFCVGTELGKFVKKRPLFWNNLIRDLRKVYSGKLVYAANWDDYTEFPFWNKLDYIGVDAYFPISKKKCPKIKVLTRKWNSLSRKMERVGKEYDKKILLTEYGYRSIKMSASKPWEHSISKEIDEQSQATSLEALYQVLWNQDFIAGGFLWRWYPYHPNSGGANDASYTVQNKMGERIVQKAYGK